MKINFLLWILLLTACSGAEDHRLRLLATDATILALGDSLTVGAGGNSSYPDLLSAAISREVIQGGVSGDTAAGALKRLPALLRKHRPHLTIVCIGGNDFLRRIPREQTKQALREIVSTLKDHGSEVLLLGVPAPALGFGLSPAPLYEELAAEFAVPLERQTLSDLLYDNQYKSDAIHLNSRGYQLLTEAIVTKLKAVKAIN